MKLRNIICFLILIFCGILTGCGDKEKLEKDITSVDYLNIHFELDETLYVGDSFVLSDYVEISTNIVNPTIQFGCEDKEIISFADNVFSCLKAGETNLYVRGKLNEDKYVYAREKVVVEERPSFYTSFELQKSVVEVDYKNRNNIKNIATYTGVSTYPVVVEYNNNILTYDYVTGLLDITAVGQCKVTVKVPISRDENMTVHYQTYTFDVDVQRYITNVSLTGYSGGINLKVGEVGEFLLNISPTKYTVDSPTLAVNSDILSLNGTCYVANQVGDCSLTLTYKTGVGTWYSKEYRVDIYDEPSTLTLGVYYDGTQVNSDLEVGKEYKLVVSADCALGNFTTLLVNSVDPATLDYLTLSEPKNKDGKIEYTFKVDIIIEIDFQVGYYKETYSATLTCIDALLTKNVVSA